MLLFFISYILLLLIPSFKNNRFQWLLRKPQKHDFGRNRMIRWESTIFGGAVSTFICIRIVCEVHSPPLPAGVWWRDRLRYQPEGTPSPLRLM